MVALFDVAAQVVDEERKSSVLSQVVAEQGPPDGTVIISLVNGGEFSDEAVNEVVERFNEVGDIIIVR